MGAYKVECKRENHKTTAQVLNITSLLPCEVKLEAPKPIVGSINIVSTPTIAKVYLDGTQLGETPLVVNDVVVGDHKLHFELERYEPSEEVVIVREGITEKVTSILKRQQNRVEESQVENTTGKVNIRFKDSRTQASVFVDGKYLGATNSAYPLAQGKRVIVVRYGDEYFGEVVEATPYTHTIDLSSAPKVESLHSLSHSVGGKKPKKSAKQK